MDLNNLSVLPLHYYPQYLKQCCSLINEEWPRSENLRMMSLQASRDALPISFILVNNDKKCVIGHCKVSRIPSIPQSCFLETVVISKSLRGKKLGSFLMRKVEQYCRDVLGKRMIHLSTKGQENFYAKLGYEICEPVSIYGLCITNYYMRDTLDQKTENRVPPPKTPCTGVPPPPPPPMPQLPSVNSNNKKSSSKTYMCKYIN